MKKILCLVLAAALMAALAGCTGGNNVIATVEPEECHVAINLGIHDNAPVVNLALIEDEVYEACLTYGSVTMVCSDGNPFSVVIDIPAQQDGLSEAKYIQIANEQCAQILEYAAGMLARTAEVDTLRAIQMCARSLSSAESETGNPVKKRLIVIDSCLSTTGTLSFLDSNLAALDPDAIVSQLDALGEIPDLSDVADVQVYSLGDVAGDQMPLSEEHRVVLRDVWQGILEAGGAKVYMKNDLPLSAEYEDGVLPAVSPVCVVFNSVELPDLDETGEALDGGAVISFDEKSIRFEPDSAVLADPAGAEEALRYVADYMENSTTELLVCGTTACTGDEAYSLDLSTRRAQSICDLLVQMGVDADCLTPVGLGYSYAPFYTYDLKPDGKLNNDVAFLNRSVKLVSKDSDTGRDILDTL